MATERWFPDEKGMPTLWGPAQHQVALAPALYWVSTAGHGGLMIGKALARKVLTKAAQTCGEPFGSFLAYEEDVAWTIPAYDSTFVRERLDAWADEKGQKRIADGALEHVLADYFPAYLVSRKAEVA